MRITSTTGATTVTHAGDTYDADSGGVFDVPEHVGRELTGFPTWLPEHVAVARHAAAQAEHDTDAVVQARRIAELQADVADLREAVAALLDAQPDDAAPKRPRAPRKPAAE